MMSQKLDKQAVRAQQDATQHVHHVPNDPEPHSSERAERTSGERQAAHHPGRMSRVFRDGLRFGRYQIVSMIASGGMSEIYEGIHTDLDKRVALKVLRPNLADNEEARQRFVSEGVNAASIRHTNVVDVTDVGVVFDLPFLVMSLLEGEDLGMLYAREGAMAVSDVVDLLLPVVAGVAAGHACGIVHRDLKPDNVFLHREGSRVVPKVLDFGVSRALSSRRITLNASVFGTPHYMSPEQARGISTDALTDQYALGVMLYEGVTGHLPRDSSNPIQLLHAVAFDSFKPPSDHVELPAAFEAVILRAMAREPSDRFPSLHDLAAALTEFASAPVAEYWRHELGLSVSAAQSADNAQHEVRSSASTQAPKHKAPQTTRHPSVPAQRPARAQAHHAAPSTIVENATAEVFVLETAPSVLTWPPPGTAQLMAEPIVMNAPATRNGMGSRLVLWGLVLAALAFGGQHLWRTLKPEQAASVAPPPVAAIAKQDALRDPADYFQVDVQSTPGSASLIVDGERVGTGRYVGRFARDGASHELRVAADGFETQSVSFRDTAPPDHIALAPLPGATATITSPVVSARKASSARHNRQPTRGAAASSSEETDGNPPASEAAARAADVLRPKVRNVDDLQPKVRVVD